MSFWRKFHQKLRKSIEKCEDLCYNANVTLKYLGEAMAVSYSKLWKVLVDKGLSKADLRKKADISPNTMTRMRKNEPVTLDLLSRICEELDVDFGDVVSYIPEKEKQEE